MNNKARYHKEWKTKFHKVALYLMEPGASFNIKSNKGGRGVLGEITLHSDRIYIQAGGSCDPDEVPDKLLIRSCKGLTDYTGGQNHYIDASLTAAQIADKARSFIRR